MTRGSDGRRGAGRDGGLAGGAGRTLVGTVTGLLGGALAWVVFLSYGFDDGVYDTWQVLGSALVFVAATVASRALARGRALWATVSGLTIGYAWPWIAWARGDDDTGLWAVGALLLVAGLLVSGFVVGGVVDLALRRRGPAGRSGRADRPAPRT